MSLQRKINNIEFSREVFVGMLIISCLFAIFLYVAIQNSTGRSLSPLAYLWPESFGSEEDRIPVVVFRTEKARREAMAMNPVPPPSSTTPEEKNRPRSWTTDIEEQATQLVANSPQLGTTGNRIGEKKSGKDDRQSDFATRIPVEFKPPNQTGFQPRSSFPVKQSTFNAPANNDKQSKSSDSSTVNRKLGDQKPTPSFQPKQVTDAPESKTTFSELNPVPSKHADSRSDFSSKPAEETKPLRSTTPPTSFPTRSKEAVTAIPSAKTQLGQGKPGLNTSPSTHDPTIQNKPSAESDLPKNAEGSGYQQLKKNSIRVQPKPNDSFWTISEKYYGSGKYFRQLAWFNRSSQKIDELPNPLWVPPLNDLIRLEKESSESRANVKAKAKDSSRPTRPDVSSQKSYTTKQGDTLFHLSRLHLDSAARFNELFILNRDVLPTGCDAQTPLPGGLKLKIPE